MGSIALTAAGAVAGVVLATRQTPPQPTAQCKERPRALVVPGVPTTQAAVVRAALARPPAAAVHALQSVAFDHPKDPVVQFNYAVVLFCAGYLQEAEQAFRAAKSGGRDTFYEIQSDALLHPQYFSRGYPVFDLQGTDPLLVRGVLAQREGHQHTAERLYRRAARLHPGSDEAQVAAAVGRFDEDDLSASFSRLGPLIRRFPRSQTVRYHLGLLLAWTGQRDQAVTEFGLARKLGPKTRLGRQADEFLRRLVADGTSSTPR